MMVRLIGFWLPLAGHLSRTNLIRTRCGLPSMRLQKARKSSIAFALDRAHAP